MLQRKPWLGCSVNDFLSAVRWSTGVRTVAPMAKPILDGAEKDPRKVGGLDYSIICDNQRAYLFLTSLNGKMWRHRTPLEDFPRGFGHCELALEAKIFEASHTYKLKGMDKDKSGKGYGQFQRRIGMLTPVLAVGVPD